MSFTLLWHTFRHWTKLNKNSVFSIDKRIVVMCVRDVMTLLLNAQRHACARDAPSSCSLSSRYWSDHCLAVERSSSQCARANRPEALSDTVHDVTLTSTHVDTWHRRHASCSSHLRPVSKLQLCVCTDVRLHPMTCHWRWFHVRFDVDVNIWLILGSTYFFDRRGPRCV